MKTLLKICIVTNQINDIPGDDAVYEALYNKHSENIGKAEVIIRCRRSPNSAPGQSNFKALEFSNDTSGNSKTSIWQKARGSFLTPVFISKEVANSDMKIKATCKEKLELTELLETKG